MLSTIVTILVPVAILLAVADSLRSQSRQRWIDEVVGQLAAEGIERQSELAFAGAGLRPRRVALVLTQRALVLVDQPVQRIARERIGDYLVRSVDGHLVVTSATGVVAIDVRVDDYAQWVETLRSLGANS
jgi:hypothetical protein